jgi:N-formylglutamate deformylase
MEQPVTLTLPTVPALPLVIDSPHSGTAYPADFGSVLQGLALRQGEDTWVHELYATRRRMAPRCWRPSSRAPTSTPTAAWHDIDTELLADPGPARCRPAPRPSSASAWCGG